MSLKTDVERMFASLTGSVGAEASVDPVQLPGHGRKVSYGECADCGTSQPKRGT